MKHIGKSIHLVEINNHRVGQWQSKMFRIVRHGFEHDTSGSLPPPAGYYTRSANLGKDYFLSISVHNFIDTTYATRQAKSLAIYHRLYALILARRP